MDCFRSKELIRAMPSAPKRRRQKGSFRQLAAMRTSSSRRIWERETCSPNNSRSWVMLTLRD
jgi:hypothetical protein